MGFVPGSRESFDEDWAVQMRARCLEALSRIEELDVDLTTNGLVRNDADAEKTIEMFRKEKIDGLMIGTVTFGDEVSAIKVASAFADLPILLFGTKEGPFKLDGGRRSDSFCGTLSISSGSYRRKIPFTFAGNRFSRRGSLPK